MNGLLLLKHAGTALTRTKIRKFCHCLEGIYQWRTLESFCNFSRYSLFTRDRQHRIDTRYIFPNACLAGLQKRWINSMGFCRSNSLRRSPSWFQHHLCFSRSSWSHLKFQLLLPAPFSSARSFQQSNSCVGHFRSFPITYY